MTKLITVKDRRKEERRFDPKNDRRQDFSDRKGGNTKANRQGATRREGKERRKGSRGSIKLMHSYVYDIKKGIEDQQGFVIAGAIDSMELEMNEILKSSLTTVQIILTDHHPYRKIK